uniref:Glutathione peroxidase n=1 Tax=Haliotis discus discus TaxID=91233 RepID=B6RB33_HALDI|nr:glutathione peroxidase [Haliotis discus discus]
MLLHVFCAAVVVCCGGASALYIPPPGERKVSCYQSDDSSQSAYNFTLNDLQTGTPTSLSQFRGDVLLIVNVAGF